MNKKAWIKSTTANKKAASRPSKITTLENYYQTFAEEMYF